MKLGNYTIEVLGQLGLPCPPPYTTNEGILILFNISPNIQFFHSNLELFSLLSLFLP